MNIIFTNLFNKQAFIATGISVAIFASSVVSAHAADTTSIAKMESQLNSASVIVSAMIAKFTPEGAVLGASTSVTAEGIQAQIAALMAQINQLGGTPKTEEGMTKGPRVVGTSASSTNKGEGRGFRPDCRPMPFKVLKDSTDSSTVGETKVLKGGDCKGNELARLMASQKEVDARIAELQAKSAQIKARIAEIKSTGSTTVPTSKTGPVFKSLGNEAVVITSSASTATDDTGRFTAKFELTANDTDVYVPMAVADGPTPAVRGISYGISQGDGKESRPGTRTATVNSTADKSGAFFVVHEGETKGFTLNAVFDPTAAGMYQLQLGALNWAATASTVGMKQVQFKPEANFTTNKIQILN